MYQKVRSAPIQYAENSSAAIAMSLLFSALVRERQSEDVNREVLRKFTQMYCEISKLVLGVRRLYLLSSLLVCQAYVSDFEKPMLAASRLYYKASSSEFISTNSVSDYVATAEVDTHPVLTFVRTVWCASGMDRGGSQACR